MAYDVTESVGLINYVWKQQINLYETTDHLL
jgi:hypothetical protein